MKEKLMREKEIDWDKFRLDQKKLFSLPERMEFILGLPPELRKLYLGRPSLDTFFFTWEATDKGKDGVFQYQRQACEAIASFLEHDRKATILVLGPMMSGKSTVAIELARIIPKTKAFKHQFDIQRYGGARIVNHPATLWREAEVYSSVQDLERWWRHPGLLIVDEVQFVTAEEERKRLGFWIEQRKRYGPTVLLGLDTNFKREPWPVIPSLLKQEDLVVVLAPKCSVEFCHEKGVFTQRIIKTPRGARPASVNDPLVVVGGSDLYFPACPKHHAVLDMDEVQFMWNFMEDQIIWQRVSDRK